MKIISESACEALLRETAVGRDSAHDLQHVKRVVENARKIGIAEGAELRILIPAAWLHDLVVLPKNSADRKQASRISAEKSGEWLRACAVPENQTEAISHCIAAHSFSAGIEPRTIEAKVLQDADRLDALGAVGIARCFVTGAGFGSEFYHPEIPLPAAVSREADDSRYILDHFFTKLFRLPELMQTETARQMARSRIAFMERYIAQFMDEIGSEQTFPT